ncbi:MAG: hypothetical protein Q9165_006970 [Trypethelium subeluteriae]
MASSLESPDRPIRICLEDPAFIPTDIQFLQSLNMHVTTGGDGFTQITRSTLVFLPFAPWEIILQHANEISNSPLLIAPNMAKLEETLLTAKKSVDTYIKRAQQITSNRESVSFPSSEELHNAFTDFRIYGAASEDDNEPGSIQEPIVPVE